IESEAGFELALELTVKAHLGGMTIVEVPTTWRDRTAGESRFQTRKWLPHYLRWYRIGILHRLRRR
ncbi:MAG: glycosyltransferase family 2 protein, partial [Candidatus Dormibacteraceae bacterium]